MALWRATVKTDAEDGAVISEQSDDVEIVPRAELRRLMAEKHHLLSTRVRRLIEWCETA